jgi:hypothetical protein
MRAMEKLYCIRPNRVDIIDRVSPCHRPLFISQLSKNDNRDILKTPMEYKKKEKKIEYDGTKLIKTKRRLQQNNSKIRKIISISTKEDKGLNSLTQ